MSWSDANAKHRCTHLPLSQQSAELTAETLPTGIQRRGQFETRPPELNRPREAG
jgi:hypothetical protein